MGTPRPVLHLVREGDDVRMLEIESGRDHTRAMHRFASHRVRALRDLDLSGFVLKKNSPSCGMTRVEVHGDQKAPAKDSRGLFASQLMSTCPNLPVEDEGRLDDAKLRENFIERVFAYRRLRGLFGRRWTNAQLVAFHTAHKLQLIAHAREFCHELGRLVASIDERPRAEICEAYQSGFMAALARPAFRGKIANVLQHAAGHLKKRLDSVSKTELADRIRDYRLSNVPLVVPVTLPARPRAPARSRVPERPDLPRSPPKGTAASQSRLRNCAWERGAGAGRATVRGEPQVFGVSCPRRPHPHSRCARLRSRPRQDGGD